MVRNSFLLRSWCFLDRRALLTSFFYNIVWTHPSAEPSCLCPAGSRLPTRRFWKWLSQNVVIYCYYRNHQQMTTAAGMRKRWSIKQKAIDFSTTPYRSIHFRQFFGAYLLSQRSRGWEQGESSARRIPPAMHSTEYGWSWTEDGCRWAYVVDFVQNTFEVFGDCEIKQEASTARFNDVGGDDDSIPPLLKSFSFAPLPATGKEFMRVLKAAMKEKGNNTYGEKYGLA